MFYIKNKDYSYTLAMYIFNLYFEIILNTNNDLFHIEIMISAAHIIGVRGYVLQGKSFVEN